MGFFAEFYAWLDRILVGYIGDYAARIATAIEPAVVTAAVLYVMVWGFLHLTARIEEPLTEGLKRIAVMVVVLGVSIRLWLYNEVIVDTVFRAPTQLAALVVGTYEPVAVVDEIIFQGGDAGDALITKGSIFQGNFSYYFAGFAVYLLVGFTAVYTIFLLSLSRVALSVLLAIGPLFLALALFQTTRRFLEAWLAQLANYALIAILTVMMAALMLTLLTNATREAASAGSGIQIAHAVRVGLAAGLTALVMRQVMPMAAGLASGIALSTFGLVSAAIAWGLGKGAGALGQFSRGMAMDQETTRWDPLSRKAGFYAGRALAGAGRGISRGLRSPNSVRPSARR
jgi:type IV secretion system protein VirB6